MHESIQRLRRNILSVYFGDPKAADRAICCALARGHLLIEDVPGVGKTLLAMSLARSINCSFSRIQLTPDMLPSDVLGVSVFERNSGEFDFKKGPIFANVVLADEINRTSPRTQSALLEAMNEATVSMDGHVHELEQPFMVVATQNPYEFEGAYLLPESQLDRFLMRLHLGYPAPDDEARVLTQRPGGKSLHELPAVISKDEMIDLQNRVDAVELDSSLTDYIVALAGATREDDEIQVGLSPRGSLALSQAARASALMDGRDYCVPEDVSENVIPVCAHRILSVGYHSSGDASSGQRIMKRIMQGVTAPT